MYLLRGYLSYLNIKMLALDHMEKEIPLATEKKKKPIGEQYTIWLLFFGFPDHFSFHFIPSLFSYQYSNSMCFTYADLYKI